VPAGGLITGVYQYGTAAVFREAIPSRLAVSPAVQLLHGATVTELVRAAGRGGIVAARWSTLTGAHGVVRAKRVVLAAGAVENARLLLLRARADGRFSEGSDWLGRGFMEHPIDSTLELRSRAPALRSESSFYLPHAVAGAPAVMGRIALAPELLREMQLPNATVRMVDAEEPRVLRSSAPRGVARRLVPMQGARRTIGNAIRGLAGVRNRIRGTTYRLLIDLEQFPHRDNRVVLSDGVDRFGQSRAALQWRWRPADEAHRVRIRDTVSRELERAAVGRTAIDPGRRLDPRAHHHAGTTRMHVDPGEGVVDDMLRVHGEENLYVAGASVFPTAGVANPTLTAIALALRLADHLGGRG
jgi:choline dehydrogenase-like flavoprotein